MNPQYLHQQQHQQQPPFYGDAQNVPPFGELNANVPPNMLKGPHNPQTYPPQKPMSGAPLSGNIQPQPQAPYYENNGQGQLSNAQHGLHPSTQAHPPVNQNNLVNQMSNISLGNMQRPPSTQSFSHPPEKESMSPSNVNGFNDLTDHVPQGTEAEPGGPPMGKRTPSALNQDLQSPMSEQQGAPTSQNLPFPGQSASPSPQFSDQQMRQQYPGQTPYMRKPQGPLPGQTASVPQQKQFPGQTNASGLPGQHLLGTPIQPSGQNFSGPPLPGQHSQDHQNLSGPPMGQNFSGPPMSGQQNISGQQNPISGSSNLPGPPMQGQNLSRPPLNLSCPPMQHNLSGPPLPGHQNMTGSPMFEQQHFPRQRNLSGPPQKISGPQQNLSGPQQNLSGPQQNLAGPPLPGQQNFSGPQQNLSGPPLPGQQNFSGPQQNLSAPQQNLAGPPLPGQQNFSGPPSMGQQNIQPHLSGGINQFGPMPGQKMYMSSPSLPGQPAVGMRQQEAPMQGYQQGYQQQGYQNPPDMYANQRNTYQGGAQGAGGYQQGMQQQQQARRLDPDHMPSPIQVIQDDQRARGGVFATNQKGLVPPLVTTKFTVQDQGNASPRFVRSTMYTVPTTSDIMKQTNVPFGLILSPMARVEEGEYEPPIVDMGEIGPVRCIRCKAYMSPFMQFIDSGRRFQCMFCKATTEVPAEYFQHLDHTGQRMDRYERPELMLGTYEFVATKDYCPENKFPKPPAIIFVIDVSYNTVKSGLVNLICAEMKNVIRNLPIDVGQSRTNMKVGFITYNNTVHFYNIKSCLAQPQMMVVGDVQDVFMPLLDGFLCDPEESKEVINSLMVQIPTMFAETRETETILAPAIQAGLEALKASECAGKLMVFHSSLPIAEAPGKLKNRDDRKLLGTEKEKTVLAPQSTVYNTLGQDCVAAGCSVDLFIFNNSYVDLATIGQVSRLTGGEIYKYTYFQADIDGERLITDVINNISRPIAFNAVMRVRTSTGVRPTDFYGHFYMSNTTDMELASIDCDKAVAIEIKHDDKLTEEEGVFVQAALLYTSCGGVRRLRIINLSLKTSSQMAELYRACDLDAIINFFSKQSVFKLLEHSPKAVKENLISRCAHMLTAYRKNCAAPSNAGQLILPECMKLLPLYVNCLIKSDAISGGADMTIDDRSYVMQAVSIMPVYTSVNYFYPRLLPLHNVDLQETGLPQMLRCSIDKIAEDGCYLLENGIHMFLWLGLGLSPQWVQGVFGVPSVVQIDTDRTKLPVLDSPLNKRVNEIINSVRVERHHCMRLTMVRQRDKLEMVFRHFLVEDKGTDGSASYVDFLCHMHKEIRALLS